MGVVGAGVGVARVGAVVVVVAVREVVGAVAVVVGEGVEAVVGVDVGLSAAGLGAAEGGAKVEAAVVAGVLACTCKEAQNGWVCACVCEGRGTVVVSKTQKGGKSISKVT